MTNDENFMNALKYALAMGHIKIGLTNFAGWDDNCNCAGCRSQQIIADVALEIMGITEAGDEND